MMTSPRPILKKEVNNIENDDDDLEALESASATGRNNDDMASSVGSSAHFGDHGSDEFNKYNKKASEDFLGKHHRQQTRAVRRSRILFFVILAGAAAALASVVYIVLRKEEEDDFQAQLQNLGSEFILLSNHNARTVLGVLQGISSHATSLIHDQAMDNSPTNSKYPPHFLTMTDAHHQLDLARQSISALVVAYMPLIESKDHDLWVEYAEEHKGWIAEGNTNNNEIVDLDADDVEITPYVWEWKTEGEGRRLGEEGDEEEPCGENYFDRRGRRERGLQEKYRAPINASEVEYVSPVWTMSPVPPMDETEVINFNLLTKGIYSKAVSFTKYSRLPSFLDVCYQANWFSVANSKEVLQTVIASPVFEDFEDGSTVVGHFVSVVPWVQFFINNLVDGSEKLMVVVSNTCNEVFSFDIDGRNATFLAEEDLHDSQFDSLKIEAPFADLYNPANLPNGDHPDDHCVYTMTVYPTEEFQQQYQTKQPMYYAIAVLAIFLFTSVAFVMFDCVVTRRQQRLLTTAKSQNAIVSSLFPKEIQKQLMDEAEDKMDEKRKKNRAGLKTFLREEQEQGMMKQAKPEEGPLGELDGSKRLSASDRVNARTSTKPIADLFPATTIMFADLAGFTKWSSIREPSEVFQLLEAIYSEFDAIAKRRGVYKVEVVGDCYVAVCGLPDPRKHHAVVMAKFASECVQIMAQTTKSLESELGADTADLCLRVGLHSGPVVAGVLRGEKARFQLFGDTMNTASRMESTGVPNRIQVSQVTANLLVKDGKSAWLTARDEMVQAKGKGVMQTYFVRTKEATNRTVESTERTEDDFGTSIRS